MLLLPFGLKNVPKIFADCLTLVGQLYSHLHPKTLERERERDSFLHDHRVLSMIYAHSFPPRQNAMVHVVRTAEGKSGVAHGFGCDANGRLVQGGSSEEGLTCEYSSWVILAPLHRGGEFY